MIPLFLVKKFGPTLGKIIFWAALILILLAVLAVAKCASDQGLKTEIRLGKNQTGAAVESGKDAVGTLGNRQAAEDAAAANVQEARDAIDNATDVGGVTGAGLDGLHRIRGKAADRRR